MSCSSTEIDSYVNRYVCTYSDRNIEKYWIYQTWVAIHVLSIDIISCSCKNACTYASCAKMWKVILLILGILCNKVNIEIWCIGTYHRIMYTNIITDNVIGSDGIYWYEYVCCIGKNLIFSI